MGGVEERKQKSQLSPGVVCVLYMLMCVHLYAYREPDVPWKVCIVLLCHSFSM